MNKKIKILLFLLAAIFIAFIVAWFKLFGIIESPKIFESKIVSISPTLTPSTKNAVELKIDTGEDDVTLYSYNFNGEKTVFDALSAAAAEIEIPMETQKYDFGIIVKSLNGKGNTSEKAWIYFVNGQAGTVAADKMKVKSGDTIEWKYIPPTE